MNLHRNVSLLTWFNFFTDFRLYSAIAILYFADVTGSFTLGMSIFSITFISSALLEIPTGIISDRVGRRKTLMLGALAALTYAICYALPTLFPYITGDCIDVTGRRYTCDIPPAVPPYIFLAAGAFFEGLSRSFYSGNNNALLHDSLTESGAEQEYAEMLGRVSSMFQIALAVSTILGSFLAEWSFALIMWISVIPQLICVIIAWRVVEPKKHVDPHAGNVYEHLSEAVQAFIRNPRLRLLTISASWGYAFGESAYQFQAAFYNTLWPVWAIGLAKTLSNIAAAFSFHFAGRIVKKVGAARMWLIGNVYSRIMCFIAGLFPSIVSPVLIALTSLTFGTARVSKDTLQQKEYTPHQRATMASLSEFAGNLLFGLVTLGVGFLADRVNPVTAFLVLQVLLLPTVWWQWRLGRE